MNFSFFALYSLLLLSFFLYLKSVPIYVIVHVHVCLTSHSLFSRPDRKVFLATWKEIAPSNEVQGSVDNVSLTAGIYMYNVRWH